MSEKLASVIHKTGQRKMSRDERRGVEAEVAEIKDQLQRAEGRDNTAPRPELLQAVPDLQRRLRKLEETLNRDQDLVPTEDGERARLSKRLDEIKSIVKKLKPSERQALMTVRSNGEADFNKSVEQTMRYQRECGSLILEAQEIVRRLDPEDPEACHVDRIFR